MDTEIYNQYTFNLKQSILIKFKHSHGLNILLQYLKDEDLKNLVKEIQDPTEEFAKNIPRLAEMYSKV